MLTDQMITTIEHQRLGFLATVDEEGAPRVSPKGTFVVIDEKTIAYGDISSPGSTSRIGHDPRVEVNFVDPLRRSGLRARGKARFLEAGTSDFETEIARFERWGGLAARIKRIVVIDIGSAKPVRTPAYDDGVSEAELIQTWSSTLIG
ncbi:pyridoxamine 5'-phosphate oxidase family protein [Roseibium sediminicola]|uniref:Pyridoxamine 5'-phosphate oxidase family protein n=1 Tax=Roseibium sediminicola TaxID=2933272 RepID=A0ABT0H382_9HYPH|nr:pyridoxamine 5'-phosphate oxidase family protein [Roseibium sp. CAU 1639]MCK7616091.1 pyridoxamine 5'-phosphate oxidase family protein [Roseibium sp. CAU 1639]